MNKLKLIFLCSLLLNLNGLSQKKYDFITNLNIETPQYQPVDILFKVKPVSNPLDLSFGANIKNDEGKSLQIEGFYNDNNQFIIRFSASKIGFYSFETYSSNPELSGLKGQIKVTQNTNTNLHGGLTISKRNPQKLAYEDSTSAFALAFECDWLFALDYENKTDIPKTKQLINTSKKTVSTKW